MNLHYFLDAICGVVFLHEINDESSLPLRIIAMSAIANDRREKKTYSEKNTNLCVMYVHYEVIYTLTVINDKKCLSYGSSMQKLHLYTLAFAQKWPQYKSNHFFLTFCIRLFCLRNCLFCRIFVVRSTYFGHLSLYWAYNSVFFVWFLVIVSEVLVCTCSRLKRYMVV